MIGVLIAGSPELVQLTGKTAGGTDDNRVFFECLVYGTKNLSIRWQVAFLRRYSIAYGIAPFGSEALRQLDPIGRNFGVIEVLIQSVQCKQCV